MFHNACKYKLTLGKSVIKTLTVRNDASPVWGEVFTFDWDGSMRFIKVRDFVLYL